MPFIRQDDIYNTAVSFSRYSTISFTGTSTEAQNSFTGTAYALGLSSGMTSSAPLFIKESGNSTITGWSDQQDWSTWAVSVTTSIPWFIVAGTSVTATTATATLTTGDLVAIYGAGTWAATGNLNTPRRRAGSVGSSNAALVAGGQSGSGTPAFTSTEIFNGSIWTASSNTNNTSGRCGTAGSKNAAIIFTGGASVIASSTIAESFNGSAWTRIADALASRLDASGAGSQNAGLMFGGSSATNAGTTDTSIFNGTQWIATNGMNTILYASASGGAQGAAFITGGNTSSANNVTNITQLFNGSNWQYAGILSSPKNNLSGAGSQNAGWISGGASNAVNLSTTELFNGSVWSASNPLSLAVVLAQGAGSQNSGLLSGGLTNQAVNSSYIHTQSLYRKLTFNNVKEAKNIGVVTDIVSNTANVKFNGYISNITVTAGNALVTTSANWVNSYLVLSRYSANVNSTNNPTSVVSKTNVEADDLVVGFTYSATTAYIYGNNLYSYDNIGRW